MATNSSINSNQTLSTTSTPQFAQLGIGASAPSEGLQVSSAGSTTSGGSTAQFGSPSGSATAGNIYGIMINKFNADNLLMGINKNSTTGQVPSNTCFISTFVGSNGMSFGRGNSAGLPSTTDIGFDGSGTVYINSLTASSLVATDGSKNLISPITTANVATLSGNQTFTGIKKNSAQPAFRAVFSSDHPNVTGDSTVWTATFDTISYDQTSSFNTGTSTYTVPISGIYALSCHLYMGNIGSGHTVGILKINVNNGTFYELVTGNFAAMGTISPNGILSIGGYIELSLSLNDTVVVQLDVRNSTKTVEAFNNIASFFSGHLIC